MATKRESYDRFRRGERRTGGKHGSYTQNVSRNAAKKENDAMRSAVIDILWCMLVPPYGIYRACTRDRCEPAVRIAGGILAVIVMYLWFSAMIPSEKPKVQEIATTRSRAIEVYSTSD